MVLEEGDIVMCTVDRIVGTVVFVKIDGDGEGAIILSEIAAGRIRNLRDYVVPQKKIVCKVLRVSGDRIDLSLRRVMQKERKEVLEQDKQDKSYRSILKSILSERAESLIKDISKKERIYDFFQEVKENPAKLEKLVGKKDSEKILSIIKNQKQKKAVIKREIILKTINPDGINHIKSLLMEIKGADIKYIAAGRYSIKTESSMLKEADYKFREIVKEIENSAKKKEIEFKIAGK